MNFGQKVLKAKKELRLLYPEIAEATGLSLSHVSRLHLREYSPLRADHLCKLAKVLRVDPGYLIDNSCAESLYVLKDYVDAKTD